MTPNRLAMSELDMPGLLFLIESARFRVSAEAITLRPVLLANFEALKLYGTLVTKQRIPSALDKLKVASTYLLRLFQK